MWDGRRKSSLMSPMDIGETLVASEKLYIRVRVKTYLQYYNEKGGFEGFQDNGGMQFATTEVIQKHRSIQYLFQSTTTPSGHEHVKESCHSATAAAASVADGSPHSIKHAPISTCLALLNCLDEAECHCPSRSDL